MSVTLLPNHEQVALDLLKAGANVVHKNLKGWTALMYASQNGHAEVRIC